MNKLDVDQKVSMDVVSLGIDDAKSLIITIDGETDTYPIKVKHNSTSILNYYPQGRNVVIMVVYRLELYNVLAANNASELKSLNTNYFLVGKGDDVDIYDIGDEISLFETEGLRPIYDIKHSRTITAIKDYIGNAYPELVIGTAIALDKDRSRVGLNTAAPVIISQASKKLIDERVESIKATDENSSNILGMFNMSNDTTAVVAYFRTNVGVIDCVIDNE